VRKFVIALFVCATASAADRFTPPRCTLLFDEIAKRQPFDDRCGDRGIGASEKKLLQNGVKNQFCADNAPIFTTFKTYRELQKLLEKPEVLGPKYGVPESREKLEKIGYTTSEGDELGEGKVVMVAAWILDAKYSNATNGGEDVNCKLNRNPNNDVHITLMENKGTDKCNSIAAEISPHYRPTIWEAKVLRDPHYANKPVRITGQLFFDASHKPCRAGKKPSPNRVSSWEIHPVYNIEICKFATMMKCDAANDANWVTLQEEIRSDAQTLTEDEEDADT
jgi:hypothetical protein